MTEIFSEQAEERRAAYGELMDRIKVDPPVLRSTGLSSPRASPDIDWRPRPTHIPYVLDFRAGRI